MANEQEPVAESVDRGDTPQPSSPSVAVDRHEKALMQGDLSKLSPEERKSYYEAVCESVGLNPLTKPLEYIWLNGELQLYANKTAANQLRKQYGVSITKLEEREDRGLFIVKAYAKTENGRSDVDEGAVDITKKSGEDLANARMKAITKAKRRVTLSICGLGYLDQTEVEDIPAENVQAVDIDHETGEIRTTGRPLTGASTQTRSRILQREDDEGRFDRTTEKNQARLREIDQKLLQVDRDELEGRLDQLRDHIEEWKGSIRRYAEHLIAVHEQRLDEYDGDGYPSEAQINRMYAIAEEHDFPKRALERLITQGWGFASNEDIPSRAVYEEICYQLTDSSYAALFSDEEPQEEAEADRARDDAPSSKKGADRETGEGLPF